MRRLSPEERALWGQVARTVRMVGGKAPSISLTTPAQAGALTPIGFEPSATVPSVARIGLRRGDVGKTPRSPQNTLDGSWDKRIATGVVSPDFTIDLHGETLSAAHAHLNRSLTAAIRNEARVVLLITGKPAKDNPRLPPTSRGVIRASVGDWLAASPYATRIAAIRGAHPRHGGAGALYLILRRAR